MHFKKLLGIGKQLLGVGTVTRGMGQQLPGGWDSYQGDGAAVTRRIGHYCQGDGTAVTRGVGHCYQGRWGSSYQWDGTAVTRGMGQQLPGMCVRGTCHGRSSGQAVVESVVWI